MTIKTVIKDLQWTRDKFEWEQKFQFVLNSWRDTPYILGQSCKKVGVDCIHFFHSVLDEMTGYERQFLRLPPDACFHKRDTSIAALKTILEAYKPYTKIEDGIVQPGDVFVTGTSQGGPGHGMIAGVKRNEIWHATNGGVQTTGIGFGDSGSFIFYAQYRPDKSQW